MVSVCTLCLALHPGLCFLYFTFLLQYFWFYFVLLTSPLASDPYSLPLCNSCLCESLPRPDVLHLCPIIPASRMGLVCVLPVLCASLSSPLVSCFTPLVPCVLWFLDPFLCSLNWPFYLVLFGLLLVWLPFCVLNLVLEVKAFLIQLYDLLSLAFPCLFFDSSYMLKTFWSKVVRCFFFIFFHRKYSK